MSYLRPGVQQARRSLTSGSYSATSSLNGYNLPIEGFPDSNQSTPMEPIGQGEDGLARVRAKYALYSSFMKPKKESASRHYSRRSMVLISHASLHPHLHLKVPASHSCHSQSQPFFNNTLSSQDSKTAVCEAAQIRLPKFPPRLSQWNQQKADEVQKSTSESYSTTLRPYHKEAQLNDRQTHQPARAATLTWAQIAMAHHFASMITPAQRKMTAFITYHPRRHLPALPPRPFPLSLPYNILRCWDLQSPSP